MYKLVDKAKQVNGEAKTVLCNLEHLVEAVSLIVVSVFTYLVITHRVDGSHLNVAGQYAVTFAVAVIALRGSIEFLKFLDNK